MAWDKSLPTGSTAINASDNAIRDNWAYLRDAIRQEHADPDASPSSPSSIVHLQGAGRIIVYTGATVLDSSADVVSAVSQLYHSTADVGRVVIDQNTTATQGAVWYCVATDTFIELPRYWGNLLVGGTLGVTGATTLTASLAANGGVVIPTTKKLQIPPGESSIFDGTNSLDPFGHAARHLFAGGDFVKGLIASNIVYKSAAGPVTATGTLLTHTFDFSTRSGNTAILAAAWANVDPGSTGAINPATMQIQLNTVQKGQDLECRATHNSPWRSQASNFMGAAFTIPNSSGQTVTLELTTYVTGGFNLVGVKNYGMILLDLATVAITT